MWLTGFDAPSMHTMYVDKTMHGAGLMQAIARVNRTFRDKPGGLIVDYIGVFANLQNALSEYSPSDRDQAGVPIDEMVQVMLEKHDIVSSILHGSRLVVRPDTAGGRTARLSSGTCIGLRPGRPRSQGPLPRPGPRPRPRPSLCAGSRDEAMAIRNDVKLFADVRAADRQARSRRSRTTASSGAVPRLDTAIWQLVSRSRRRRRGRRRLQAAAEHREARAVDPVRRVPRRRSPKAERPNLQLGAAAPPAQRRDQDPAPHQPRPGPPLLRAARRGDQPLHEPGAVNRRDHRRPRRAGQGTARLQRSRRSTRGSPR